VDLLEPLFFVVLALGVTQVVLSTSFCQRLFRGLGQVLIFRRYCHALLVLLATSALLPVIGATAAQFRVHGVLIFANASLWAADSALGHGALHHELDWFTAGHIDVLSLVSRRGLIRSRSLAGFRHRCFHGCEPA